MSQLPKGYQYVSHNGKRARLRNLTHACRPALAVSDDLAVRLVARARALGAATSPTPEYAALTLVSQALQIEQDTGTPWRDALGYLLDDAEAAARARTDRRKIPVPDHAVGR